MSYSKYLVIAVMLLLFFNCKQPALLPGQKGQTYPILISEIDNREIPEGTSMRVHFAAIDDHLEMLKFHAENLPAFVKIVQEYNGKGFFQIDPPFGSKGTYNIRLFAENNGQLGVREFLIKVQSAPRNILYLSPKSHDFEASGTREDPLPSLEAISKVKFPLGKEMNLYLQDGYHGHPHFSASSCNIYAAAGAKPVLSGISFEAVSQVAISGITISPEGKASFYKDFSVVIDSLSNGVNISNCEIKTAENTTNWTQDEWDERANGGIITYGDNCIIENNFLKNIFHAVQTDADNIIVKYNIIDRFAGDAIRNTGDNNIYSHNLIKNAVVDDYSDPDGNHDDCFQSWTFGKPISNIIIKDNIAISCLEPNLRLKARVVQGIACFDGFEENWIIEGNLVLIDHPHGIALFGAKKCIITKNTVLRNPYHFFDFESNPWIMINDHKDGRPSSGNIVKNNLCDALEIKTEQGINQGNIIIDSNYDDYFQNYEGWDFRRGENK